MTTPADQAALDPITREVIRNKLRSITEEQAITLKAASGSPVVTEATDFNNGLYLADGSIVTMGPQVLLHAGAMASVIRSILADFQPEGQINEGDMFILNDPYRGAVHQSDVAIVAPVFWEGEHIAWAGSCAHQLDFGGIAFGGWAFQATEIQQEALLLPGVKLVEGGRLRTDVWRMIMGMTRLPEVIGLDLKAMIAANHVAGRRMGEVMGRYGADTVEQVMVGEIDASERRLRDRLRQLPDGTFRAVDFLEHDGHRDGLYDFCLTMSKTGDELVFDMAGSSAQAPGFINNTRVGLVGAVFTALIPVIAPDIPWNEGVLRPITITAPEASVCNARWPAPVSSATVSGVWSCMNASVAALARMAWFAPETRSDAPAVTKGSMVVFTVAGSDREGEPYANFLLDSTAGGGGAYADHDGLDGSGDFCVPRPAIANVEAIEAAGPLLYLYRSFVPDTGGPGRRRGGCTLGIAVTPHDAAELQAMVIGHGSRVPNSSGLLGGYEGSCNRCLLITSEDGTPPLGEIVGPASLDGGQAFTVTELGPKPGFFGLRQGAAFAYSFMGGGGIGDPLDRDPELVGRDVAEGLVTPESAARHYGVVLGAGGSIDTGATADRRAEIRTRRLNGHTPSVSADASAGVVGLTVAAGRFRCRCGQDLGPVDGDWKAGAETRTISPEEHGWGICVREELELREHVCPACATLLESELVRVGAPDLRTIEFAPCPKP